MLFFPAGKELGFMAPERPTMIIGRIKNQGDKVVLYGQEPLDHYRVVATLKEAKSLHVGNTIRYQPKSMNSGWFVSLVEPTT
ncbi:MAG: hypothetical protein WCF77_03435 [Minisyncoccia bacterium]